MEETRSTPIEQSNVVAAFSNEGDHHGSNDSWIETSQCHLEESVDCASLSQAEKDWTSNELKQHQEDAIGKWIVKKPKSLKQKLPRRDKDGNLVLKKWCCNASKKCLCPAEVKLIRNGVGRLVVLTRGSHSHEEMPHVRSSQGLPHKLKVALLNYVDSDLVVPKIMRQLELDGFDLGCTTKKQIKNFLSYNRKNCTTVNTIGGLERFIDEHTWKEGKSYTKDECFIIDHKLVHGQGEHDFLKSLMISFSTPQMLDWAKSSIVEGVARQMTVDATFKIFTNDTLILLASGTTDKAGHWFPIIYSIVPTESMESTTFHLQSLWILLGDHASDFFDDIYVLKDAGAGLHAGVQNFSNLQGHNWHQQDCYAHLSRVDGNLQQAFKRYHVPPCTGTLIGSYIKRISYATCKEVKESLLQKFEHEFAQYTKFITWWRSTYGGPFKYWGRCDAPSGYPVSNQGHESNNNTFKRIHMPSRSTQRRMDVHKALLPLTNAISSLVREKVREYEFQSGGDLTVSPYLWEKVNEFMLCYDWTLRQKVGELILFPTKVVLDAALLIARERAIKVLKGLMVHSTEATQELVEEVDLQLQNVLHEEATALVTTGLQPLESECMESFFNRTSKWIVLGKNCSCHHFQDKGICKHNLATRVESNELKIPDDARVLRYSKLQQMKLHLQRERTMKQKMREASNVLRLKRLKAGIDDLNRSSNLSVEETPAE